MANNTSIQEQLTYKAIIQIASIIVCIFVGVFYILPSLSEARISSEKANTAVNNYTDTVDYGISATKLAKVIESTGNNAELLDLYKTKSVDVKSIITKDAQSTEPYIEWLNNSLRINDDELEQLKIEKAKINTIIPTLSPFSDNLNEDNVTLRDYIAFVEQKILQQFNITSFSSLGISGIQYKKDEQSTNPIGKFQIELHFTDSTVNNILSLLEYVHNSGDLNKTETLSKYTVMGNPLITIDSFSVNEAADSRFGNSVVSGKITLSFYIRGSSETDKNYLLDSLNKRKTELATKIQNRLEECNRSVCPEEEKARIEKVQKKFNDFNRSLVQSLDEKQSSTTEVIYIISQQLQSISSIEDELATIK